RRAAAAATTVRGRMITIRETKTLETIPEMKNLEAKTPEEKTLEMKTLEAILGRKAREMKAREVKTPGVAMNRGKAVLPEKEIALYPGIMKGKAEIRRIKMQRGKV
ncbi:MAG TPA: hypothetical protein GX697_01375, partial [Firmicutes bacterium]|nr:hypothetical protein [Bacillota bacterium]